ncbi:MAG TPA: rhomboid family intramembrane serine protease [Vicinamibacterales bacterium]|nr:rhomboid family intramembrane serine protease [Vicinamibacterales bacterium]
MGVLPLVVLLAAVWYFTTPKERDRVRREVLDRFDNVWGGVARYWPAPTPFDAALAARMPRPLATLTVLALNVGIFVCMLTAPGSLADPATLVGWGASIGTRTANGEWWRLATSMFVHGGFVHMFVNVLGVAQIGLMTERFYGSFAFANAYLGAGLLFGVVSVLLHPVVVTAGGSASVFAIYGMFATMLFTGLATPSPFTVPRTTLLKIAGPAALFFLYSFGAGHAGVLELSGLVVGLIYGFILAKPTVVEAMTTSGAEAQPLGEPAQAMPRLAIAMPMLKRTLAITAAIVIVVIGAGIPMRGVIDVRPEIARIADLEDKTASKYDRAVREFTNGQMTIKELVAVIERSILPELRAAQTRLSELQHVPREQAKLVADADQYFKLREESWKARAAGLRRTSLKGMRSPDDTEREARELLDTLRVANP